MPTPGQILGGKYRLERLVGSGGFASVWAARNVMLDRLVALKILSENYARMPGFLPRFLREAKLASRQIHKVIVAVEDIDQTPEGLVFLVMELLQGETLADALKGGKTLSLQQTLEIIVPTLEGLSAAHSRNIIHRDIKPANIFLTNEGSPGPRVRILDLGLAKDLVSDDELTSTDQMVGTPSYLAPEMFMGPQTRKWAPTADVFACGMLMFRMLAGGLPFDRSVAGLPPIEQFLARADFYQKVGQMPGPAQYVSSIPTRIDAVVRKAISLKLSERYSDAAVMLDDLQLATSGAFRLASDSRPSSESQTEIEADASFSIGGFDDLPDSDEDSADEGDFDEDKTRIDASPFGFDVEEMHGGGGNRPAIEMFDDRASENPTLRETPSSSSSSSRSSAPGARSVPKTLSPEQSQGPAQMLVGPTSSRAASSSPPQDGQPAAIPSPPTQPTPIPTPAQAEDERGTPQQQWGSAGRESNAGPAQTPSQAWGGPQEPQAQGEEQRGTIPPEFLSPGSFVNPSQPPQQQMQAHFSSDPPSPSQQPPQVQSKRSPLIIIVVILVLVLVLFLLSVGGLGVAYRMGYLGQFLGFSLDSEQRSAWVLDGELRETVSSSRRGARARGQNRVMMPNP